MAKTRQQWLDEMEAEKASHQELQSIDTTSKFSVWGGFFFVISFVAETMGKIFDQHKVDTQVIADSSNVGIAKWYELETRKFQYGDDLVWDPVLKKFVYETVDLDKQIADQVAVSETGGAVVIKVATDNNGLQAFNIPQLAALDAYWKLKKPAGTPLLVLSNDHDLLKADISIIYNPLVLSADGSLINNSSIKPVEQAIQTYLSTLDFNGRMWVDQLENQIKSAQGVVSVKITQVEAKASGGAYQDVDHYYDSISGYLQLDSANSSITYDV